MVRTVILAATLLVAKNSRVEYLSLIVRHSGCICACLHDESSRMICQVFRLTADLFWEWGLPQPSCGPASCTTKALRVCRVGTPLDTLQEVLVKKNSATLPHSSLELPSDGLVKPSVGIGVDQLDAIEAPLFAVGIEFRLEVLSFAVSQQFATAIAIDAYRHHRCDRGDLLGLALVPIEVVFVVVQVGLVAALQRPAQERKCHPAAGRKSWCFCRGFWPARLRQRSAGSCPSVA